jgi:hypothetical protein
MKMTKWVVLALVAAAAASSGQTVNCVAAIVNGQLITRLDVEIVAAFRLGGAAGEEPGADARLAALDTLIDRKLVLDLAREARTVTKDELEAARAELVRTLGDAAFGQTLARFGLKPQDLDPYLEDRLLFDQAMGLRFSPSIPVSITEVERFYRDIYVPEQARAKAAAEPLDKVGATIEARIRADRRAGQIERWVRDLRKNADIQIKKDCLR